VTFWCFNIRTNHFYSMKPLTSFLVAFLTCFWSLPLFIISGSQDVSCWGYNVNSTQSGPRRQTRLRFWPSIQNVWGLLPYMNSFFSAPASRAWRSAHIWEKQICLKMQHRKNMPSRCQVVSLTFIATEWFYQLKKIVKFFFNISGRLAAAR